MAQPNSLPQFFIVFTLLLAKILVSIVSADDFTTERHLLLPEHINDLGVLRENTAGQLSSSRMQRGNGEIYQSSNNNFTTTAKQALVFDYTNDTFLFGQDADEKMNPSSMSKLMTLYVVFSKIKEGIVKMDDVYTVSRNAWEKKGSTMFLREGQKVKVADLLKGIAILSGNDASVTIAEGSMGSEDIFAHEMNHKAKAIGLNGSNFVNATGLTAPDHYMTARDVVKLAVRIYEDFPEYYYLFREKSFIFNDIKQNNTNEMLSLHHRRDLNFDGVKTGRTDAGGFGLISSFVSGDRRFFILVNGLDNKSDRSREIQRLAAYSLRNFKVIKIFTKEDLIATLNMLYYYRGSLPIVTTEDVSVVFEESRSNEIAVTLRYRDWVSPPLSKGERVGELIVKTPSGDKTFSLVTSKEAKRIPVLFYLILRFFR